MKHLKYPLALFLILLLAKLGYIFIESAYNYDVLSITTNSELSEQAIENLNHRGHLIASFGFTLLLMPLFYFFVKRKKQLALYFLISIFSIISFSIFYHSLNYLVEYIVKENKEKQYEAYYTNLLKYGIINGVIYYNSFIPKERINNLTVNDKILLTNIFLLSGSDPELIDKFRNKGEKNTIELYLQKYKNDDYQKKLNLFKKMFSEVEDRWIEFNNEKKKLAEQLSDLNNEKAMRTAFKKMTEQLTGNYNKYQKAYKNAQKELSKRTQLKDLKKIKNSLDKYFKYRGYKKAQTQYQERMVADFGHYIEPKAWKNKEGNITYPSIIKVIKEQIELTIKKKAFGLPSGLNKSDFFNQRAIKVEVAKKLKKKDIAIPVDFDYSYEQFKKYYTLMKNRTFQSVQQKFSEELEKKIGKNDLTLETEWNGFIFSDYLKRQILAKIGSANSSDLELYQKVLLSRNINNFRSIIYMPKALSFASKNIIHEKEQFKNDVKIAEKGDQAIKLLYIPPIALGLSIIALLLNIVTVLGMLLQLFIFRSALVIGFIQVALIATIILIPLVFKAENLQNKMLSNATRPILLNSLQWASFWERANYLLHSKI